MHTRGILPADRLQAVKIMPVTACSASQQLMRLSVRSI